MRFTWLSVSRKVWGKSSPLSLGGMVGAGVLGVVVGSAKKGQQENMRLTHFLTFIAYKYIWKRYKLQEQIVERGFT